MSNIYVTYNKNSEERIMKIDNLKRKVSELCRKVGRRNFIIMGAVLLTAVAVGVNLIIFAGNRDDGYDYDKSAGMDAGTADTSGGSSTDTEQTSDSYFSSIQVNRQRTRDEAIEVLQAVVDNDASRRRLRMRLSLRSTSLRTSWRPNPTLRLSL